MSAATLRCWSQWSRLWFWHQNSKRSLGGSTKQTGKAHRQEHSIRDTDKHCSPQLKLRVRGSEKRDWASLLRQNPWLLSQLPGLHHHCMTVAVSYSLPFLKPFLAPGSSFLKSWDLLSSVFHISSAPVPVSPPHWTRPHVQKPVNPCMAVDTQSHTASQIHLSLAKFPVAQQKV